MLGQKSGSYLRPRSEIALRPDASLSGATSRFGCGGVLLVVFSLLAGADWEYLARTWEGRGRRKYRSVILDGLGYRGANLNLAFSPFSLYLLSRFG